jgi:4-amino-4-deoxy-L-arabinose transferase-like glycosyltransferase
MKWAAWGVGGVVAIAHLLTAGRYDFFVNELYFIVCGRHPAFGYVDQPPLVPLLSALTQIGGTHVWLLRIWAVLAAALLVPLTVALAGLLGSSTRGAWLAAIAAATAPMLTAITSTVTTSTFEPIDFTAVAYFLTRAVVRDEPRSYWWAGAVAGLAFESRYGIILWGVALALGVLAAGPRSIFRSRDLWIGIGIAVVLAAPNALWQIAHGLPFLELVRNDSAGNLTGSPLVFTLDQIFSLNVVLAPLWIAGFVAPFFMQNLARFRFLAIAFVATGVLVFVSHGKSYYLAGAYPTAFALGAAACTALPTVLVAIWATLAALNGALALPFVLPIYSPERLRTIVAHSAVKMKAVEVATIGAPLTQVFSDEFGWRELAQTVGDVYASLPEADRAKAAIYAHDYGEASAINVLGANLPTAISGNNQYYLWGPQGYDGSVVIAVNVDAMQWSQWCNSVKIVGRFGTSPYVMPREADKPIVVCRGMHPPLAQLWPQLKYYGI